MPRSYVAARLADAPLYSDEFESTPISRSRLESTAKRTFRSQVATSVDGLISDIWPDPSLRPTSAIAQRLVHASYCVIDTPILLTAGVIASIEACDAGVSSGPVRPARRAQPARHRSSE